MCSDDLASIDQLVALILQFWNRRLKNVCVMDDFPNHLRLRRIHGGWIANHHPRLDRHITSSAVAVNLHFRWWRSCEGGVDVVGVVTPLRGGAQVVLHGDQVVKLSVLLGVREEGEVEEDGEGQVEVERDESEVREKRTWMTLRMR